MFSNGGRAREPDEAYHYAPRRTTPKPESISDVSSLQFSPRSRPLTVSEDEFSLDDSVSERQRQRQWQWQHDLGSVAEHQGFQDVALDPDSDPAFHKAGFHESRSGPGAPLRRKEDGVVAIEETPLPEGGHPAFQPGEHRDPIWLHTGTLLVFSFVFGSLSVVTGFLYFASEKNAGLSSASAIHHYAWQYGPTLVLTVLASLWRMVDVTSKSLMPWQELRHGPASAERTLLLDYLSPILPVTFLRAFKNRHWCILATLSGHLLLILMTVFSTGLLALKPTEIVEYDVPMLVSSISTKDYSLDRVGTEAASLAYATQFLNLSYPLGTTSNVVVPTFEPFANQSLTYSDLEGYTVHATVEGLATSFSCEAVPIQKSQGKTLPWFSLEQEYFLGNVTTSDCNVTNARVGVGPMRDYDPEARQSYQGWIRNVVCNQYDYSLPLSTPELALGNAPTAEGNTTADNAMLLTVADVRYNAPPDGFTGAAPQDSWVQSVTAVLCKPSYSINKYRVSYSLGRSGSQLLPLEPVESTSDLVPGFHYGDLSAAVALTADHLYLGREGGEHNRNFALQVPALFQMMQRLEPGGKIEAFMDSAKLSSAAAKVLGVVATQLVRQELMQPPNGTTIAGSVRSVDSRLRMQPVSTGIICAGLALMAGIGIAMVFIKPLDARPQQPGSVMKVAEILPLSPDLRAILSGLGSAPMATISSALASSRFVSYTDPETKSVGIRALVGYEKPTRCAASVKEPLDHWWRPFGTRRWFYALAVVVPLLIIGSLEAVQQVSNRQDGFAEVQHHNILIVASYIATALALCVRLLYSSLEFTAAVFTPFTAISQTIAPASKSISVSYLTKPGPHAWVVALLNQHFGLVVILTANFLGAFLPMVVASLYSESQMPYVAEVSLRQADKFDLSKGNIGFEDNLAGAVTSMITYNDVAFPKWTYASLAFPSVEVSAGQESLGDAALPASLRLKTLATRSRLNCTQVTPNVTVGLQSGSNIMDGYVQIRSSAQLDWSMCDRPPSPLPNATTWSQRYEVLNDSSVMHIGKASPLQWRTGSSPGIFGDGILATGAGNYINFYGNLGDAESLLGMSGLGCPSFALVMGTASVHPTAGTANKTAWTVEADLGALVCWQNVEEVEVDLTLKYPDLVVPENALPIVNEASARKVLGREGGPSFEFNLNNFIIALNRSQTETEASRNLTVNEYALDKFMRAVTQGKDAVPLEQISGASRTDALLEASQRLYGHYMAQAMSYNMRIGVDSEDEPPEVSSSTVSQSTSSKLALNSTITSKTSATHTTKATDTTSSTKEESIHYDSTVYRTSIIYITRATDSSSVSSATTTARSSLQRRAESRSPAMAATLTRTGNGARTRLKQNQGSKTSLQVMLAIMTASVIAMYFLLRTRDVLPHDPCSIAGTAALLVDGSSADATPARQGRTEAGQQLYTMGWHVDRAGKKRFGIRRASVNEQERLIPTAPAPELAGPPPPMQSSSDNSAWYGGHHGGLREPQEYINTQHRYRAH